MRRTSLLMIGVVLLAVARGSADESSWTAPPSNAQLQRDPTLIPKSKGFLFVPALSVPLGNEPSYFVYLDGERIASAPTGRGVLLNPGTYDVLIGSGAISQLIRKTVPIVEGQTTMLKPDWAALVIDVIDATRTSVNETYEILETDGEPYGVGYGIEEERGERVRTWLLRPGVYHVVRVGESVTTIRKFSVQLTPGTLTQRNLVVDTGPGTTGDFIGFYPRPVLQTSRAERTASSVTSQTEMSGSVQFNSSQQTAAGDQSSLNLAVQMFNRTRYNTERDFANIRVILEEGASKVEGEDLSKGVDRAEVQATYIYRLSERIGPYLRGVVNSNAFPSDSRFRTPRDLIRIRQNGSIDTLRGITEFTTAPSLSPVTLREGIGINAQVIRSFGLNMDLRLGIGARQDLRSEFYEISTNSNGSTQATERGSTSSTGLETLLIMDARLARYINLDSEFDILITSRDTGDWFFTWENRMRIALTSFINLDIVADLEREQTLRRLQGREQLLLRFSRFF
jgi:hypothetical protein